MKSPDLFSVKGKTALVTGASSGLGVTFAEALAEAGANVEIVARRHEKLLEVAKNLETLGVRARAFKADITQEDQVRELMDDVKANFGGLDILVNNAGSTIVNPSGTLKIEDWKKVVDVNLTALFLCSRSAAKLMIDQRRGGKIINISSIFGILADTVPEPPYYASKSGVIGLTRYHAVEWAPFGIQVNSIAPGFFRTEMNEEDLKDPRNVEKITKRTPLARLGNPDDLKGTVLYLASAASDFVTGQTLAVDGGRTIWL
jgi:NAD(P)-dependent dehydrogenase (short-subunit alcohol dehydrogenase family)